MIVATTPRLVLRPLEERDAGNIFLLNSDPQVLKYVHDVPFASEDAARQWIADVPRQLPNGFGRWAIETRTPAEDKGGNTWIGRCSLRRGDDGNTLMGYRLLREHWGRGFASGAVRAMLALAFGTYGLTQVTSKVARENTASIRVILKCGGRFVKEDACGNFADALVYAFEQP